MAEQQRTIGDLLEEARRRIDRLAPTRVQAEVESGGILIDIRCQELRDETGTIPGARHIPLSVLYWRLDQTSESNDPSVGDRDRRIILICAHGYSSSLAAATLRDLGFARATDVEGGFEAWAAAGLPVAIGADP